MLLQLRRFFRCAAWVGYVPYIARILGAVAGQWIGLSIRSSKFGKITREKVTKRLRHFDVNDQVVDIATALEKHRWFSQGSSTEAARDSALRSSIVAGLMPIADTLTMAIWLLHKHPTQLKRLDKLLAAKNELDNRLQANVANTPPVPLAVTDKIEYLRWVLLEVLRCHSPFAHQLPRVVPAGGLHIGRYFLPKDVSGKPDRIQIIAPPLLTTLKVNVGCNPWAVHYSHDLFGTDVKDFLPERWDPKHGEKRKPLYFCERQNSVGLTGNDDTVQSFFAFGKGPRVCLGKGAYFGPILLYLHGSYLTRSTRRRHH